MVRVIGLWSSDEEKSLVQRDPQYPDSDFRRFVRRYQLRSLVRGKAHVTAAVNERQASRWRPSAPAALTLAPSVAKEPAA